MNRPKEMNKRQQIDATLSKYLIKDLANLVSSYTYKIINIKYDETYESVRKKMKEYYEYRYSDVNFWSVGFSYDLADNCGTIKKIRVKQTLCSICPGKTQHYEYYICDMKIENGTEFQVALEHIPRHCCILLNFYSTKTHKKMDENIVKEISLLLVCY